ncbi:hypothetical protein [Ornithinibacillus scapharcae]|uniref:hypothetical protein n=1 Tax=Ornithinibacillus scapharcae TaxID=1147159 RepID=UPI000225B6AF|nr:hypothetical protein [Ornithinibacillus scapharcae]
MKKMIIPLLFTCILLSGCVNKLSAEQKEINEAYIDNKEIIGSERVEMIKEISATIFDVSDRSNSTAEPFSITLVEPNHEFSVPEGRYLLVGDIAGTVTILDENGDILIKEVISTISGYSIGVTVDIQEQHTIRVNGFENFSMTPVPTDLKVELGTGIWHVGVDIEPGNYKVTAPYGFGYLQVLHPDEEPQVIEIISGPYAHTTSNVELKEGEVLRITRGLVLNFKHN